MSCGYQGYEFGAPYPDSICVGGQLHDADYCDDNGALHEPGEYVPCPMCYRKEAIAYWKQQNLCSGSGSRRDAARAARSLVRDIRRNRKNGTEPWKRAERFARCV